MADNFALFDLDGTLLDTIGDLAGAANDLRRDLGHAPADPATIASWVGNGMRWLVRRAMVGHHDGAPDGPEVDEAVARFRTHYQSWNGRTAQPYPGIPDLLTQLRDTGWQLACVTNKPESFARDLLKRLQLARHFPVIVGGDTLPVRKPDPAVISHTLDLLGAQPPGNLVFIGDSATDVATARRVGIPVVAVDWGYNHGRPIATANPDRTVATADDLRTAVEDLATPAAWSWHQLAAATGGTWHPDAPPLANRGIAAVTTDTRALEPGQLFLCLRGDRFDGHNFIDQAVTGGAAALIVDQAPPDVTVPTLVVPDTLRAYGDLGTASRHGFAGPVVCITGSSGKTSTRAFVGDVARCRFPNTLETIGNTNNFVGAPQNLMRLTPNHHAAILEIGTNAPGEIARLSQICEPTIGVITSIGPVHLEGLGSIAGVADEKSSLLANLPRDGIAVLPCELRKFPILEQRLPARVLWVGDAPEADVRVHWHGDSLRGARFSLSHNDETCELRTRIPGRHQAGNAALAVAVGIAMEIPFDAACRAIESTALPGMRMRISEHNGVTWINDAYNANPDSAKALIEWLAGIPEWKRASAPILVLGDMFELGADAAKLHRQLLETAVAKLPHARIVGIGEHFHRAAVKGVETHATIDSFAPELHTELSPGQLVALKGSRGMRLESLLPE